MKNITNRITIIAALVALTAAFAAPAAHAGGATEFYSSLTDFNAAATTATTYDFEGIAPTGSFTTNPPMLVTPTTGQVTFSATGGNTTNVLAADSDAFGGTYQLSDGSDSVAAGNPNNTGSVTRINLGNLYTAFAIDYGMQFNATSTFTFALFDGATEVGNVFNAGSAGGDRFFGATSTVAFDNVRVTATNAAGAYAVFDNARVGSEGAVAVPEAGSLALVLPAFAMVGIVIVRRRK